MGFRLIPREEKFFDLFNKQAEQVVKAAECFVRLAHNNQFLTENVSEMGALEHQCDEITHDIIDKLNRTFITPFDREDIHALAHEMDSVVDLLDTIVGRMGVYHLQTSDALVQFSDVILKATQAIAGAVGLLHDKKQAGKINEFCIEINRLENVGDDLRDQMLARLFENEKDPFTLIKWKDVYQDSESVLDQCEDVANIIESIIVKQA